MSVSRTMRFDGRNVAIPYSKGDGCREDRTRCGRRCILCGLKIREMPDGGYSRGERVARAVHYAMRQIGETLGWIQVGSAGDKAGSWIYRKDDGTLIEVDWRKMVEIYRRWPGAA